MRAVALALVLGGVLVLLGVAPASASASISARRARAIAIADLGHFARQPNVVVFGLPHPLGPGAHVSSADRPHGGVKLRHPAWLFWADVEPTFDLDHLSLLLVLDASTGHVVHSGSLLRWPLINGHLPAFLSSRRAYQSSRYHVLVHARAVAAAEPNAILAVPSARAASAAAPGQCVIVVGPPSSAKGDWFWGEHYADAAAFTSFAKGLGIQTLQAHSLQELSSQISGAQASGCSNVTIFMTGEGSPSPGWIDPTTGMGPFPGNPRPNLELDGKDTRIYGPDLAQVIEDHNASPPPGVPAPNFTLILQGCFTGRFIDVLDGVPGVGAVLTSSGPDRESLRESNGEKLLTGPNQVAPFVVDLMTAIRRVFGPDGGNLGKAAQTGFGMLPTSDDGPEMLVDGKVISKAPGGGGGGGGGTTCTGSNPHGGIDLTLYGDFFGQVWAGGTVTASSSGGGSAESASVGSQSVSVGHFGPWPCGTTTTLTATPARGDHFVSWPVSTHCSSNVLTCHVPIGTTTEDLAVHFAPTVYQLSITNEQPDGIATSGGGGGYVYPGIQCGSGSPNGPTTPSYTMCSSGAVAQRSDTDLTQVNIVADNPGPGDRTYGIDSIAGCDSTASTSNPAPGGGSYVASVQCFIDMTANRTIAVNYKDVGPAQ